MNVVVDINDITNRNIQYYEPIENTVLEDSIFIRTGYSNKCFTTNGIYINVMLHIIKVEKYFNKYRYIFDYYTNTECIDRLIKLEKNILDNYNCERHQSYKLKEQLQNGIISLFESDVSSISYGMHMFTLKISGIWISCNMKGITYKFFHN